MFGPWAPRVTDAAGIASGDRVLDVGCGTGILARNAAERVGSVGRVTGLDLDEEMLSIARRAGPSIEWGQGDATVDAVVRQFALMYFPDRVAALREMLRVLRSGGRLAVAMWAPHEHATGYVELARTARRYAGEEAVEAVDIIRKPHVLGKPGVLRALFDEAGIVDPKIRIVDGVYTQPSIDYFMESEVKDRDQILEYLEMGLNLASVMKIVNAQMDSPIAYNSYRYFVRRDRELLADWRAQSL